MIALWTLPKILEALTPTAIQQLNNAVFKGISIDSRTTKPGDLYIAICGPNNNGHDYVDSAIQSGATLCIVSENRPHWKQLPIIEVRDTVKALNSLGIASRSRCSGTVIGVTGSAGKTSTKNLLFHSLSSCGATYASPRSFNNLWGVPYSLASMPDDTKFGIIEMGMNHANEISPLSKMARPQIAIITNVGTAHLEFFDSVEGIALAKSEIFDGMPRGSTAILNKDNPFFTLLCNKARDQGHKILSFGSDARADIRLIAYDDVSAIVKAEIDGSTIEYNMGVVGIHHAYNSLAVLAGIQATGENVETAAACFSTWKASEGRGAIETICTPQGQVTLIDESYNANPDSVRSTIRTLGKKSTNGRKILFLGDMKELGKHGPELHQALAKDIIDTEIDIVHTCGDIMKFLHNALPPSQRGHHCATSSEMSEIVPELIQDDDTIVVKGSLSMKMAKIIQALKSLTNTEKGKKICY